MNASWSATLVALLLAPLAALTQLAPSPDAILLDAVSNQLRTHLPGFRPTPVLEDGALVGFRVNHLSQRNVFSSLQDGDIVVLPDGPFPVGESSVQEIEESIALLVEPRADAPIRWQLRSRDGSNREFVYEPPEVLAGPYVLGDSPSFPPRFANALSAAADLVESEDQDASMLSARIRCGEESCHMQVSAGDASSGADSSERTSGTLHAIVHFDVASGVASKLVWAVVR